MRRPWTVLFVIAGITTAASSLAYSESADDFVEPECNSIFEGNQVSDIFVDMITDLALPKQYPAAIANALEPPAERSKLTRWPAHPRLVVQFDGMQTPTLLSVVRSYHDALTRLGIANGALVVDYDGTEEPRNGDIFIVLSQDLRAFYTDQESILRSRLARFYGSDADLTLSAARHKQARDHGFVDVIGGGRSDVARAVVALDSIGPSPIRDPELFQLLTTAINPNPGNEVHPNWIYDKVWRTQIHYTLRWTKTFAVYLRVLEDAQVESGMSRSQFEEAANRILNTPTEVRTLREIFRCK